MSRSRARRRYEYEDPGDQVMFGLAKLPRSLREVRRFDELRTLADENVLLGRRGGVEDVFVRERDVQRERERSVVRGVSVPGMRSLEMRLPERVAFCVRRKIRREVLFALDKAGYGGSARKRHWDRTEDSNYGC